MADCWIGIDAYASTCEFFYSQVGPTSTFSDAFQNATREVGWQAHIVAFITCATAQHSEVIS